MVTRRLSPIAATRTAWSLKHVFGICRSSLTNWKDASLDERGAMAAEFALMLPVLAVLIFGAIQFGIALTNYEQLTYGARSGIRSFSAARGSTTPLTAATTALDNATPNLTSSSITVVFSVNGTTCTTDAGCATALGTAAGLPSKITATYPCNLTIPYVTTVTTCTLSTAVTSMVE